MTEINNSNAAKPLVSFVVPVYNVEESLRECLISVVFQTLPETEVIIVNDASPDHSQEIIDEFVTAFPEKVKAVKHDVNQGLAMARKTGLHHVSAPYVLFVDSDDFVNGNIAERLYNRIVEDELDILYYPFLQVDVNTKSVNVVTPSSKGNIQDYLLRYGRAGFVFAMYRTEFLKENEEVAFRKGFFEDAAATPVLISKTNRIGLFKNRELYYYRVNRKGSITSSVMTKEKMEDYQAADLVGWDVIPDELKAAYAYRVLKRAAVAVKKYPEIYDYTINHIKSLTEKTDKYTLSISPKWDEYINMARRKPDSIAIPKIVYINGFIKKDLYSYSRYTEEAVKAYLFSPELCVLNSEQCDINLLPPNIKNAGAEEIGLYFALRAISERGGIYIGPQVQIVTSFNKEAYSQAFFVAGANYQVLSCAFGAAPGNPAIQSMLQMVDSTPGISVVEAISRVLIADYGAYLDGKEQWCIQKIHILPINRICYSDNLLKNYCFLNYSNLRQFNEDMISIPMELNEMSWRMIDKSVPSKKPKESSSAQDELNKIKNSRAWGIVTRLYEYRDLIKNKKSSVRRFTKSILKRKE